MTWDGGSSARSRSHFRLGVPLDLSSVALFLIRKTSGSGHEVSSAWVGSATTDVVAIPACSRVPACLFHHPPGSVLGGKRYKIGDKFRSARVSWNSGGRLFCADTRGTRIANAPKNGRDASSPFAAGPRGPTSNLGPNGPAHFG